MSGFNVNIQSRANEIHTLNELCTSKTTIFQLKYMIMHDDRYDNISDINSFKLKYNNIVLLNDNNLEFYGIIDSRNIIKLYFTVTKSDAYQDINDNKNDDIPQDIDIESLKVGQILLVEDKGFDFIEATIISINLNDNTIGIHFVGYPDVYDETINVVTNKDRIKIIQEQNDGNTSIEMVSPDSATNIDIESAQYRHHVGLSNPEPVPSFQDSTNDMNWQEITRNNINCWSTKLCAGNCCDTIYVKCKILLYDVIALGIIGIHGINITGFINQLNVYSEYSMEQYGCDRIDNICILISIRFCNCKI